MRTAFGLLAALVVLVLAACAAPPRVVGPGLVGNERFGFELLAPWSRIASGRDREVDVEQLTRSGPLLDRFFLASLEPGQGLVTPGFEAYPRWWSGTPADALDDFFAESLEMLGYEQVETVSKIGRDFAGAPGVRYGLVMRRPGGLSVSGDAMAAVHEDRLDLVLFLAPSEHYFPARRGEVEHVFDTLTRVRR
jgi:hypothetical protein